MTKEQLANAISKSEFLKGLGYFKELQDTANEGKFAVKGDTINTVKVNGTALEKTNNAVDVLITVAKKVTANDNFAASYEVKANGVAVGDPINIPKDYLVKSATLKTVIATDKAEGGFAENDDTFALGDKYIDFVVNTKADGDGTAETDSHIRINVNDLIDVYTNGNGLNLSNGEFSIKLDATGVAGLTVGANGLKLAEVTATTYTYQVATGTYFSGTTYYTDNTGATVVDTSEFVEGTTDVSSYFVKVTTAGTAGAMSVADKDYIESLKATTFVEITRTDVQSLFA